MKNVISYCLWGDNQFYVDGAIFNVQLAKKFYPEWVCRFYVEESTVPKESVQRLLDELKCAFFQH